MKKVIFSLHCLLGVMLMLVGMSACKKTPVVDPAAKPNWVAVEMPDYFSSMTMICLPPEGETPVATDELAAFIGGNCLAVAKLENGVFYLGVPGPENITPMEVRYYSTTLHSIRTAKVTYTPEASLGSVSAPIVLEFGEKVITPQRIAIRATVEQEAASNAPIRMVNIGEVGYSGGYVSDNLYWRSGDKLLLQDLEGNSCELTLTAGADTHSGNFEGWSSASWDGDMYVTYPVTATYEYDERVLFSIPAAQTYVPGNFANDLLPMYASVTLDVEIYFHAQPVASVVCLQLKGSKAIRSIAITSSDSRIVGDFIYDGSDGTTGGNASVVTLTCPDVQLTEDVTKFYIVLPAVTLGLNSTFTITPTEGEPIVKTLTTPVPLFAGVTKNFPVLTIQ